MAEKDETDRELADKLTELLSTEKFWLIMGPTVKDFDVKFLIQVIGETAENETCVTLETYQDLMKDFLVNDACTVKQLCERFTKGHEELREAEETLEDTPKADESGVVKLLLWDFACKVEKLVKVIGKPKRGWRSLRDAADRIKTKKDETFEAEMTVLEVVRRQGGDVNAANNMGAAEEPADIAQESAWQFQEIISSTFFSVDRDDRLRHMEGVRVAFLNVQEKLYGLFEGCDENSPTDVVDECLADVNRKYLEVVMEGVEIILSADESTYEVVELCAGKDWKNKSMHTLDVGLRKICRIFHPDHVNNVAACVEKDVSARITQAMQVITCVFKKARRMVLVSDAWPDAHLARAGEAWAFSMTYKKLEEKSPETQRECVGDLKRHYAREAANHWMDAMKIVDNLSKKSPGMLRSPPQNSNKQAELRLKISEAYLQAKENRIAYIYAMTSVKIFLRERPDAVTQREEYDKLWPNIRKHMKSLKAQKKQTLPSATSPSAASSRVCPDSMASASPCAGPGQMGIEGRIQVWEQRSQQLVSFIAGDDFPSLPDAKEKHLDQLRDFTSNFDMEAVRCLAPAVSMDGWQEPLYLNVARNLEAGLKWANVGAPVACGAVLVAAIPIHFVSGGLSLVFVGLGYLASLATQFGMRALIKHKSRLELERWKEIAQRLHERINVALTQLNNEKPGKFLEELAKPLNDWQTLKLKRDRILDYPGTVDEPVRNIDQTVEFLLENQMTPAAVAMVVLRIAECLMSVNFEEIEIGGISKPLKHQKNKDAAERALESLILDCKDEGRLMQAAKEIDLQMARMETAKLRSGKGSISLKSCHETDMPDFLEDSALGVVRVKQRPPESVTGSATVREGMVLSGLALPSDTRNFLTPPQSGWKLQDIQRQTHQHGELVLHFELSRRERLWNMFRSFSSAKADVGDSSQCELLKMANQTKLSKAVLLLSQSRNNDGNMKEAKDLLKAVLDAEKVLNQETTTMMRALQDFFYAYTEQDITLAITDGPSTLMTPKITYEAETGKVFRTQRVELSTCSERCIAEACRSLLGYEAKVVPKDEKIDLEEVRACVDGIGEVMHLEVQVWNDDPQGERCLPPRSKQFKGVLAVVTKKDACNVACALEYSIESAGVHQLRKDMSTGNLTHPTVHKEVLVCLEKLATDAEAKTKRKEWTSKTEKRRILEEEKEVLSTMLAICRTHEVLTMKPSNLSRYIEVLDALGNIKEILDVTKDFGSLCKDQSYQSSIFLARAHAFLRLKQTQRAKNECYVVVHGPSVQPSISQWGARINQSLQSRSNRQEEPSYYGHHNPVERKWAPKSGMNTYFGVEPEPLLLPLDYSCNKTRSRKAEKEYRILSCDGGGIKGIIPGVILAEIEARTHQSVAKVFNMTAGTSTGSILATGLIIPSGIGNNDPRFRAAEVVEKYVFDGPHVFKRLPMHQVVAGGKSLYDPCALDALSTQVTTKPDGNGFTMGELLLPCLVPVTTDTGLMNYTSKLYPKEKVFDIVRSSCAAPAYFPAHQFQAANGEHVTAVDGGVAMNNPAEVALEHGKTLAEGKDVCLISLGCGEIKTKYDIDKGATRWAFGRDSLSSMASLASGADEVHVKLEKLGLPYYQRINPALPYAADLADSSGDAIAALLDIADAYLEDAYASESNWFNKMVERLSQPPS